MIPEPCVDAEAAVRQALGNIPPVQPTDGSSFARGTKVRFTAAASDEEDGVPTVTWTICGNTFMGISVEVDTHSCPFGAQMVTAVASDSFGWSVRDAGGGVPFVLTNTPPTVVITKPTNGTTFSISQDPFSHAWSGETIALEGTSSDLNNASGSLSDSEVKWLVKGSQITGHQASVSALTLGVGSHRIEFSGTDDGGLQASQSVTIEVKVWEPQQPPCRFPC